MMQQVDLLGDELRPGIEPLTVRQVAVVWGALVVALVLFSTWQGLRAWSLAADQAERQSQWQTMTRENAELQASVVADPDPELVSEVAVLRELFQNQTLMVEAVRSYEQIRETGFSGYLNDLAAQHVDGLALDRIEFNHGGTHIVLSGETVAPIRVPQFLKRLSDGSSFRGHRFDEFRLEAQDSGLLRFDIVGPARESGG